MRLVSFWTYGEGAGAPAVLEKPTNVSSTMRRSMFGNTGIGYRQQGFLGIFNVTSKKSRLGKK